MARRRKTRMSHDDKTLLGLVVITTIIIIGSIAGAAMLSYWLG